MDSISLATRLNPRVVARLSSDTAEKAMSLAGVHSEGIRIMSAAAGFLVVCLDSLPRETARSMKEVMLSLGSDAAMEESAWAGGAADTPLVIMGTRRQLKGLLKSLSDGEETAPLAALLAQTLDNYNRHRFRLKIGPREVPLEAGRPHLMGILNVTPDSFSDGGKYADLKAAVAQGVRMAAEGARIIDVGGESTRPGSAGIDAEQETARVVPVIKALSCETECPISIDTSKASVAAAALEAGASIVNDVTALSGDPAMAGTVAVAGCPVVLMHMKGTPLTMQTSPFYRDLMGEISRYLRKAVEKAVSAGIDPEQVVIDPGIGFGKTIDHNLEILRRLKELSSLGRPILVGPSRKSFIGGVLSLPPEERTLGTAAACALATAAGASILRVHDVAEMRQSAAVAAAVALGAERETG